jgi:hypothetical protein
MAIDLVSLRENMGLSVPLSAALSWRLHLTMREPAENRVRRTKENRVNARLAAEAAERVAERLGAVPQAGALVVGHARR